MNDKKLGFGFMRLPLLNPSDASKIDYEAVCEMVDKYMSAGFNYFDTAAPYHGGKHSEAAVRECVVKRYPRESFTVTDKLSFFMVDKAEELEEFFESQLSECGLEYFDYYLLHAMNKEYLELAERIGAFDFVEEKKAQGKIRHVGFSFHDSAEVLDEMLTRHPEMEYVQLQINYIDWEDSEVQSRKCYEVCEKHNKPVIVMEPVKGGLLAEVLPECEKLLKEAAPDMSAASWALRFASSLPNVVMVLSGMSNSEQADDNISFMKDFKPLTDAEKQLVMRVGDIIRSKESIACTACRYCVDGCPKKIPIPDYFKLMNNIGKFGERQIPSAKSSYASRIKDGAGKASECVKCYSCEEHCPQRLPITEYLENVASALE